MHRVELKDRMGSILPCPAYVPNAPCGVERRSSCVYIKWTFSFLMHRVELKASRIFSIFSLYRRVPNAPCGVESLEFSENFLPQNPVPNAPCGVESVSDVDWPNPDG